MQCRDLFERAKKVMPGGVNSPVRSFKAVGREPIFIKRAQGSKIYDVNEREYIDYVCSWGPMILGHNRAEILRSVLTAAPFGLSFGAPTEQEVLMAELICSKVPNVDMVRMVNSGTEAVMSALRLARGVTGRAKVIKFDGCYHGHSDGMLVKAGSGALTYGTPDSLGVTDKIAANTLIARYNDLSSVAQLLEENSAQVAAIIVEPVAANMGVVAPKQDFLQGLRKLCDAHGTLLVFDEVITGFRLAFGGAQEYFNVAADIVIFGKIIGGGMPVGAYAGRYELMKNIAPLGDVYQAGTLSGNPIAMAAGYAQLSLLNNNPEIYKDLTEKATYLADSLRAVGRALNINWQVNNIGSLVCMFFTEVAVVDFASAKTSDTKLYAKFFNLMLRQGINLAPAQYEAMFISAAHTAEDLDKTISAAKHALIKMNIDGDFQS